MECGKFFCLDNLFIDEILQKYCDCLIDFIIGLKGFIVKKLWNLILDDGVKYSLYVVFSEYFRMMSMKIVIVRMLLLKGQDVFNFKEIIIDGVLLVCFSFGGEKRVCYMELVNKVLKDFDSKDIDINWDCF